MIEHEQETESERRIWAVPTLWSAARSLPVKRIPISDISEFDQDCWFGGTAPTCREVAEHFRRINEADLSFPVILSASGRLMDGGHRICKAWLMGEVEIDAVQFLEDPIPDQTLDCRFQTAD